jgi:Septum formation
VSQPPMPPGPPTKPAPQPQPQPWPQQGMQPPDRGVNDPDPELIAGWTPPPWTEGPDVPASWTPPPWSPHAADTRPSWRPAAVMIGYVVLIVLIGIGIGLWATVDDYSGSPEPVSSYSTDPTTTVDDLAVGDCFDDGNAEGVVRLPCTVAHDGEIIGIVTLPEGPYPGDNGVDKAADRACTHDFTKYVGKSVDDSELDLYYWPPNEDRWNDDDRVVVCDATYNGYVYAKLTGTIKNSHR